jgi:hypothetical protein
LNLEEDTIISLRMTVVPKKYASVAIAFSLATASDHPHRQMHLEAARSQEQGSPTH